MTNSNSSVTILTSRFNKHREAWKTAFENTYPMPSDVLFALWNHHNFSDFQRALDYISDIDYGRHPIATTTIKRIAGEILLEGYLFFINSSFESGERYGQKEGFEEGLKGNVAYLEYINEATA